MHEGFRFVARTAPIRALLLLLGVVSFAGMPYAVLMPVFAESILHGGARGLRHPDGRRPALGALGGALLLAAPRERARPRALGRGLRGRAFGVALIAVLVLAHLLAVGRCCWCRSAAR